MNILGFPTFQTFEMTSYESICTAFLTQLMMVMKNRKMAVMEAKNEKSRRRRKFQIQKEEENWRTEVVRINEAFQHLTRKLLDCENFICSVSTCL